MTNYQAITSSDTHPPTDIRDFRHARIKGDYMDDQGFLTDFRPKFMLVAVSQEGRIYDLEYGFEMSKPERWGDGDRIGRRFVADAGEFERCGITFDLCGSTTEGEPCPVCDAEWYDAEDLEE